MNEITGPNIGVQFPVAEEPAEASALLSASKLRAYSRKNDQDEAPVFVIYDGEVRVEISHEFGKSHPELAAMGLRRVATAALAHAELIEHQAARGRGYS
jgi:hypothetical protein